MAIYIHPFSCLLAQVPKFEPEPSLGGRLCDCGIYSKRGEDDLIGVVTENPGGYCAQSLGCKIRAHIVQDCFIVEQCVMSMPDIGFGWWELAMSEEVKLVMSDLTSKIGALAHPACNGNACTETGPLASFCVLVACTKLDILRYSDKV